MFMLMYICIYVRMFIICIYQCMYTCTHACEYTKIQFAVFSLPHFLIFLLLSLHSLTICPSCPSQTLKDLSLTLSLLFNSWEHGSISQRVFCCVSPNLPKFLITKVTIVTDIYIKVRLILKFSCTGNATEENERELLAELAVMKSLEPHPNVIKLLGCITKSGNLS